MFSILGINFTTIIYIDIILKIRISNVDEVIKLDLKIKCNPELHITKFFLKKKEVTLLSLEDIKDVDEL